MIRKMVVAAAAVAMCVSGIGVLTTFVGSGVAGAKSPTVVGITCDSTGSVNFVSPGLTVDGTTSGVGKDSTTKATLDSSNLDCNGNGVSNSPVVVSITTKNTKCDVALTDDDLPTLGEQPPRWTEPPSCPTGKPAKKTYYDDLAWSFAGSGASDIVTALKKGIPFDDSGTALTLIPTSSTAVDPNGACGGSTSSGFDIKGTIKKATGASFSDLVCLTTDTGTDTSNVFTTDLTDEVLASSKNFNSDAPADATSIVITSAGVGSPTALTITPAS